MKTMPGNFPEYGIPEGVRVATDDAIMVDLEAVAGEPVLGGIRVALGGP